MITGWEIYWFTRLDPLKGIVGTTAVIGLIISVLMFLLYPAFCDIFDYDEEKRKKSLTWTVRLQVAVFSATVLFAFAHALTPTTREMAAIKVIPMIANSESVQKLGDVGDNMLDLANEWLQELKPGKEKLKERSAETP